MPTKVRLATFNLENFGDETKKKPSLQERIAVMRPQLSRINADILCLQEVSSQENASGQRELSALKELIAGTQYEKYHLAHSARENSNELEKDRNLVVLSRFEIRFHEQIKHKYVKDLQYRSVTANPEEQTKPVDWERPLFHVKLDIGRDRLLHVIVVHLKSKIPSDINGQVKNYIWSTDAGWAEGFFLSSMKRVGQALETRIVIDKIFDEAVGNEEPFIATCGDFNADINDVPLAAICGRVEETGNASLGRRVMIPCEFSIPESSRFSILYLGKGLMFDHILVSRPLLAFYRGAESQTETLADESGAFRTDDKFPESDHAPVIATFEFA